MTRVDIDEVLARANAATLGPWLASPMKDMEWPHLRDIVAADRPSYPLLSGGSAADGEFIAHAREDIPAMAQELKALREDACSGPWMPEDEVARMLKQARAEAFEECEKACDELISHAQASTFVPGGLSNSTANVKIDALVAARAAIRARGKSQHPQLPQQGQDDQRRDPDDAKAKAE